MFWKCFAPGTEFVRDGVDAVPVVNAVFWAESDVVFADLLSHSGKFATIDYSDDTPALYLGEATEFESLKLKNLRTFEGW